MVGFLSLPPEFLALYTDDFNGSAGTDPNWNPRPDPPFSQFTIREDGNSNLEFAHNGSFSGSGGEHQDIYAPVLDTSNESQWTITVRNFSHTNNSNAHDFDVGFRGTDDDTDAQSFSYVNPPDDGSTGWRILWNTDPSASTANENTSVPNHSGSPVTLKYQFDNGTFRFFYDGTQEFSASGFNQIDWYFRLHIEDDASSSSGETALVDSVTVERGLK